MGRQLQRRDDRKHFRADIQGIRGLAVLLVVLYHVGLPVPGGFVGVDVFFVVSGFVIAQLLLRELDSHGSIDYRRFFRRRVRRLLPALALMLIVVAIASIALLGPLGQQQRAVRTGVAASLFVANAQLTAASGGYFSGPAEANPFLHTWSLSAEEQFYLFLPFAIALGWRLTSRSRTWLGRNGLWLGSLLLLLGSFVITFSLSSGIGFDPERGQAIAFYSSFTRVWQFMAGVLVALTAARIATISQQLRSGLAILGLAMIFIAALTIGETIKYPGLAAALPVAGTVLLLSNSPNTKLSGQLLASRGPVWLGDRSYSWYLWHWPFIVIAQTVWPLSIRATWVALAMSLLVAAWSYRYVEQPIRLGYRFPDANGFRVAVACIAAPLVAITMLSFASSAAQRTEPALEATSALSLQGVMAATCPDAPSTTWTPTCTVIAEELEHVVLVGDSNAVQFARPLVEAARKTNMALTVLARPACPFVQLELRHSALPQDECISHIQATVAEIESIKPDMVIVASASDIYINQARWEIVHPDSGALVGDSPGKAELWRVGLEALLDRLDSVGAYTVIVNPIPHFFVDHDKALLENCPAFRLLTDPASCGRIESRHRLEEQRHRAVAAEQGAAQHDARVRTLDFMGEICDPTSCAMYADGEWLYRDGTHLSVVGSLTLVDEFAGLLAQASES